MQMTPEQFCYWLQGRAELQPDTAPTKAEWKMIREHLQTVFVKVTPPLQTYFPKPGTAGHITPMSWAATCETARSECQSASNAATVAICAADPAINAATC